VFGVGATISALAYVTSFYFITAALHRRIWTFECEFPELVDGKDDIIDRGYLGWGGVVCCGWPGPSLRTALWLQIVTAVGAAITLMIQAWLNAKDFYQEHRAMEVLFVVFAAINLYLVVRLQLTLNILPTQDVRSFVESPEMIKLFGNSPPPKPVTVERLSYTFTDLLFRTQIKVYFVMFMAIELILLACFNAVDFDTTVRMHLLPLLQWLALLMYCVAYASFIWDIRLSETKWTDWDHFLTQRQIRRARKTTHLQRQRNTSQRLSFDPENRTVDFSNVGEIDVDVDGDSLPVEVCVDSDAGAPRVRVHNTLDLDAVDEIPDQIRNTPNPPLNSIDVGVTISNRASKFL